MKAKIYFIAVIIPLILLGMGAVSSSDGVIDIVPDTLPEGGLDEVYNAQLEAVGSVPPNTWKITNGSLPPGDG